MQCERKELESALPFKEDCNVVKLEMVPGAGKFCYTVMVCMI